MQQTPDGHVPRPEAPMCYARELAQARAEAERRKLERKLLGYCPCGETQGEAVCPVCDLGLPPPPMKPIDPAIFAELSMKLPAMLTKRPWPPRAPEAARRGPNRLERRRSASRKWHRRNRNEQRRRR